MPRRSFGRHLVAYIVGFLCGHFVKKIAYQQSGADRASDSAKKEAVRPKGLATEVTDKPRHPSEEEHRTAEQLYWRKSIFTTWATIVIAGIAAIFSYKAFQETRRQANAAEENNRPWVQINGISTFDVRVEGGDVGVRLGVSFENIGHDPAQDVEVDIDKIRSWLKEYPGVDNAARYCRDRARDQRIGSGVIAFPNQKGLHLEIGTHRTKESFVNATMEEIHTLGIQGQHAQMLASMARYVEISINGCVLYRFPGHAEMHYTTFVFAIALKHTRPGASPIEVKPFDVLSDGQFGPQDIKQLAIPFTTYAD